MKSYVQSSRLSGSVRAPASKSVAQRAIFASLLSKGISHLKNWSWCEDSYYAVRAAERLGARVSQKENVLTIEGGLNPKSEVINAGESGLSSRILSSLLLLCNREMTLTGMGSLRNRSFAPMLSVYNQLGVDASLNNNSTLPLKLSGRILAGDLIVDASMSSQFVSGLMFSLGYLNEASSLKLISPKSIPYLDLTQEILYKFGVRWKKEGSSYFLEENSEYRPTEICIEGDWSAIAFLIAAGMVAGNIEISNLPIDSKQADKAILLLFPNHIDQYANRLLVKKGPISGFEFDASHCPDLFPPLVAIAANATSVSQIKGSSRLKNKESDRASTLQSEFSKLGVKIEIKDDVMFIFPNAIQRARVHSHNDHRIAMALTIAGLNSKGLVEIEGTHCVSKSYPKFFSDLQDLGAEVTLKDEHEQLWANF